MNETEHYLHKLSQEFENFTRTMDELRLLRTVAKDLRSYRRMIKIRRYD